jgi:hypothetical protein
LLLDFNFSASAAKAVRANTEILAPDSQDKKSAIVRRDYLDLTGVSSGAVRTVDRIKQYGCNSEGEPLVFIHWFEQYLRMLSDWRIPEICTSGASQTGKTLGHHLVAADALIEGQLSFGWIYPGDKIRRNEQPKFRKLAERWISKRQLSYSPDRNNTERFEIGTAIGNFTHSNTKTGDSKAANSQSGVAFPAAFLIYEEHSLTKDGVDYSGRKNRSPLETKPDRYLGTAGGGSGIEIRAALAPLSAIPSVDCPECDRNIPLIPQLVAMKPDEHGNFFKSDSRPHQLNDRMTCPCCEAVLDQEPENIRLHLYETEILIAVKTDKPVKTWQEFEPVWAEDFLDQDLAELPNVAIWIYPTITGLADSAKWLKYVSTKIEASENPAAAVQELLGIESSIGSGLSRADAEKILGNVIHNYNLAGKRQYSFGLDQGVHNHYLWVASTDPDGGETLHFLRSVKASELQSVLSHFGDRIPGFIDNEPDKSWAANFTEGQPHLKLANQGSNAKRYFFEATMTTGGTSYPIYEFTNQYWIAEFIRYLYSGKLRVAEDAVLSEDAAAHLSSLRKDGKGMWRRPASHDDDLFFAGLFWFVRSRNGITSYDPLAAYR